MDVLDVPQECPKCGGEMYLVDFCPDCEEQARRDRQHERHREIRAAEDRVTLELAEVRRRARAYMGGKQ